MPNGGFGNWPPNKGREGGRRASMLWMTALFVLISSCQGWIGSSSNRRDDFWRQPRWMRTPKLHHATSPGTPPLENSNHPKTSFHSSSDPSKRVGLLLTFDLDDTLFPTDQVVTRANHAMLQAMYDLGVPRDVSVQDFLDTTRQIRKSLTTPITYQGLRKRAIHETFQRNPDTIHGTMSLEDRVEFCYGVWVTERHLAAERYLYSDALSTLQEIRTTFPHWTSG